MRPTLTPPFVLLRRHVEFPATNALYNAQRESATRLAIKQTNCRSHRGFVFRIRVIHRLRYHAYNLLLFRHFIGALAQVYFCHRKVVTY